MEYSTSASLYQAIAGDTYIVAERCEEEEERGARGKTPGYTPWERLLHYPEKRHFLTIEATIHNKAIRLSESSGLSHARSANTALLAGIIHYSPSGALGVADQAGVSDLANSSAGGAEEW